MASEGPEAFGTRVPLPVVPSVRLVFSYKQVGENLFLLPNLFGTVRTGRWALGNISVSIYAAKVLPCCDLFVTVVAGFAVRTAVTAGFCATRRSLAIKRNIRCLNAPSDSPSRAARVSAGTSWSLKRINSSCSLSVNNRSDKQR